MGTASSEGRNLSSSSSGLGKSLSGSHSIFPDMRLATILLVIRSSERLRRSFHIINWLKEKSPRKTSSSTSQRDLSSTAWRNRLKTREISTPFSSAGRGSRPSMVRPKSWRSISRRVTFIWGSSSRILRTKPFWAAFRTMSTGMRTRGEYLSRSLTSDSYHFKKPRAK